MLHTLTRSMSISSAPRGIVQHDRKLFEKEGAGSGQVLGCPIAEVLARSKQS